MFSTIGSSEILLTLAISLIILGPEKLISTLRSTGIYIKKLRFFASDLQKEVLQEKEQDKENEKMKK